MLGAILGLGSAATFGVSSILTRRGMLRVSSNYIATISVFTGPPFFLLVTSVTGDIFGLGQFPWQAYVFFALSGVIHFAFGRTWGYKCIQIIGSTRSNTVTSLNPTVTVVLAVILLKETITPLMLLGILLSLSGPLLIVLKERTFARSAQPNTNPHGKELDRRTLYKGLLYGIGAAILWGSSSILVKLGLENGGTPVAGTLIAYLAASIAISPSSLLNAENKREILKTGKQSLKVALIVGLATSIAQLLRYLALGYGSVIVVSFMSRTIPLWVLLFALIFNRQYESFSRWVLLSNTLLMTGTLLVLFS